MIRVGIIGGTGYTGRELLRLFSNHREVKVAYVSSRDRNRKIIDDYPFLSKEFSELFYKDVDPSYVEGLDVIFFATPSNVTHRIIKDFYDSKRLIIDISPDFRLNEGDYEKWYNFKHMAKDLIDSFVYCIPEVNRKDINKDTKLIANPGCYPTSILIPLIPVLQVVSPSSIIIDSKSGVSGAGKRIEEAFIFCEVNESLKAYSVGRKHRHIIEIEKYIKEWTGKDKKVVFTPHLIPMNRGIISTIYLTGVSIDDYKKAYDFVCKKYENEVFVKITDPQIKNVIYTNQCHFNLYHDGNETMIIVSAIDNLVKGASGQAIQNMNIALGINEWEGLC